MATKKRISIKTPAGTACFVNVFTPRVRKDAKGQPKGEPKYSMLLVWPKGTDLSELEEEIERVAIEKFGNKAPDLLAKGKLNNPLREAMDYEEYGAPFNKRGAMMANFKTGDRPGVVDADAEPIMDKSDFYSGCEARVSCRVFSYDNESKGVGLALINCQKLDEGTRLSGNPSAEDEFNETPAGRSKAKRPSRDDDEDEAPRSRRKSKSDDYDGML